MEDQKYLFHLWWFSDRPFQNLGLVDPGCCESCHVFSFLPFIPSELVHWATKHLSRVLNSNNPNLIFSPWLSLVTPETDDQWGASCGSVIKNQPMGSQEPPGSPASPEGAVEAAGRLTDLAEVSDLVLSSALIGSPGLTWAGYWMMCW